jgi:hypothetical protein
MPWGIDWNGKGDCHLFTESVLGPPVMHFDIDATINNRCGNKEPAKPIAIMTNRHLNKRLWKKAGTEFEKLMEVTE